MQNRLCSGHSGAPHVVPRFGHKRPKTWSLVGRALQSSPVSVPSEQADPRVEIDCYPDRQDLSVDLLAIARKEGCRISMGTDSHSASQLEFMELGVAAALRAKLDPKKILNYMSTDQSLEWAKTVRGR
jgi:hypothetical protein